MDLVPTRGHADQKLAKWVVTQREYYNKKTLAQDRIDKLNAIGFAWRLKDKATVTKTVDCDSNWKRHFHNLERYKEKHGDTHGKLPSNRRCNNSEYLLCRFDVSSFAYHARYHASADTWS